VVPGPTLAAASTDRPLWQWTATEVVVATRSGAVSCREVAASAIDRLRAVNPRLNAVTLDLGDTALAAADGLDARRLAGEPTGPLFGVPITIKDNVEVRGQRTPNGVAGLAHIIARDDAPIVRRLIDAGAVIVGRTNTPEFSMRATTNNALYGLTLNPWDARISCGGSSGGAAAAVATGMCAVGHGNDIAGSIRFPALHCGVAGFKPTTPGDWPLASVQGPLARSIGDIRVAVDVMAPRPPDGAGGGRVTPVAAGHRPRVGLIAEIPGMPLTPSVVQALADAVRALEEAGYVVEPIEAPDIVASGELWLRFLMTDLQQVVVPVARRLGSEQIRWYFDAWVNGLPPFTEADAFREAVTARNAMLARWRGILATYPVIVLPQRADMLLEVDEDLRSVEHLRLVLRGYAPSATMNLLGLPAAVVPTGLADGLPAGVQVVAGWHEEARCLAAAEAIERGLGTLSDQLWARPLSA
jgi:amidase